ncbi:MAG: MBL fold metallo-hydrolase [Desulfobacterales bacterium]
MKVTTLIENGPSKTDRRLAAEWGLSLYIEFNGHNILFDTGASSSFAKNAEHLSLSIASVDTAVLSHHHFDHGGGLKRFFELNSNAKVHLAETPNGECFAKIFGFVKKDIGLDKNILTEFKDRFNTIKNHAEILPDVFIFPHIVNKHPKPKGNKFLFLKKNNSFVSDDFAHEMVMAIKENEKLIVFTGCSHNGILNMVDTVSQEFKGIPIKAVIGGFHLIGAPPFGFMSDSRRKVEDLGRSVLNYPVDETYTGHCTGKKAFEVLKSVMGDRITDIRTGSVFEI